MASRFVLLERRQDLRFLGGLDRGGEFNERVPLQRLFACPTATEVPSHSAAEGFDRHSPELSEAPLS